MPSVPMMKCPVPFCGGPLRCLQAKTRKGRVVRTRVCKWCGWSTLTEERIPTIRDVVEHAGKVASQ